MRLSAGDPGSYSTPHESVVIHTLMQLDCDFEKKVLSGQVTLDVTLLKPNIKTLILDTKELTIKRITNVADSTELKYSLDSPILTFGSKLTIQLPPLSDNKCKITIEYVTSRTASALQWLSCEQTAGKKHPYLFSQCQPDHARSLIPCQDTPAVKGTFTAEISSPKNLTVLMSAIRLKDPVVISSEKKLHFYQQSVPVPSYLIALAVGHLESRELGSRSKVWSEPENVDAAAYEFAKTDDMLITAENLCGKYVWGRYDILVLPPSFPYGGMENPCLTFITPTLIAGDRSLVNVIAHEISHSWTGNLVSIQNFEHFWLNEGFTTFIERKIIGRISGENFRQFHAIGGLKDLKQAIISLGDKNPLTKLVVNLDGVDPDEAFSVCPYEKGHSFLFYLEQLLGGVEIFESFLRSYFEKFKFQSIETNDFKNYLLEYFHSNENLKKIDWDQWLYSTGMPLVIPEYDRTLQKECTKLLDRWLQWNLKDLCPFSTSDLSSLLPDQIIEITALILELDNFPLDKLKKMSELYNMSSYPNSEIKFRWLRICIKARWEEKVDAALEFANSQGRLKYTRPIYKDLYGWEQMREKTIASFLAHKSCWMYIVISIIDASIQNIEQSICRNITFFWLRPCQVIFNLDIDDKPLE